jgi:hypothetical protein
LYFNEVAMQKAQNQNKRCYDVVVCRPKKASVRLLTGQPLFFRLQETTTEEEQQLHEAQQQREIAPVSDRSSDQRYHNNDTKTVDGQE